MKTNTRDLIKVQYKYDGELVGAMDNIKYQYIYYGFIERKKQYRSYTLVFPWTVVLSDYTAKQNKTLLY